MPAAPFVCPVDQTDCVPQLPPAHGDGVAPIQAWRCPECARQYPLRPSDRGRLYTLGTPT